MYIYICISEICYLKWFFLLCREFLLWYEAILYCYIKQIFIFQYEANCYCDMKRNPLSKANFSIWRDFFQWYIEKCVRNYTEIWSYFPYDLKRIPQSEGCFSIWSECLLWYEANFSRDFKWNPLSEVISFHSVMNFYCDLKQIFYCDIWSQIRHHFSIWR